MKTSKILSLLMMALAFCFTLVSCSDSVPSDGDTSAVVAFELDEFNTVEFLAPTADLSVATGHVYVYASSEDHVDVCCKASESVPDYRSSWHSNYLEVSCNSPSASGGYAETDFASNYKQESSHSLYDVCCNSMNHYSYSMASSYTGSDSCSNETISIEFAVEPSTVQA